MYLYVHDVPSGQYLTARNSDDEAVFWLGAGYIEFVSPEAAVSPDGVSLDEDGCVIALSRRMYSERGATHHEENLDTRKPGAHPLDTPIRGRPSDTRIPSAPVRATTSKGRPHPAPPRWRARSLQPGLAGPSSRSIRANWPP